MRTLEQIDAQRSAARRKYEAARPDRAHGTPKFRAERENDVRPFVAIDSEGGAIGEPYSVQAQSGDGDGDFKSMQPHKSFLWGAGDIAGEVDWLYSTTPLKSIEIIDFLLDIGETRPKSIFVSFAFGYDVAQMVADLPYEKLWELQHGVAYKDKECFETKTPTRDGVIPRSNSRRVVYWKRYGLQYLKGKQVSLFYVHDKPQRNNDGRLSRHDAKRRIRIYDVFGFFQASFLKALDGMASLRTDAERAIVEKGKAERGLFDHSKVAEIKDYTRHELMLLCRMMNGLRGALIGQKLHLTSWHGAGSIAQALMKRENVKRHLGERRADLEQTSNDPTTWGPQAWAHHAFFGGRIELMQQGRTENKLYGYDIASAYPAGATTLSSLENGHWKLIGNGNLQTIDRLSMVRLRASFLPDRPFYPLPYRTPNGGIYFPRQVYGIYMRDEALAAMEYCRILGGEINILDIYQFHHDETITPFTFLRDMFDYRKSLPKEDITQIVIKLGINSVYGKFAQSVGQWGTVPALASPIHAAAITAWTRSRLLMAALRQPETMVMFATDGIISTARLPLDIPATKTLGEWEEDTIDGGAVFVQSGVYAFKKGEKWTVKSRGFRPANVTGDLGEHLWKTVPDAWRMDREKLIFPYQNYMTVGASSVSRETAKRIGQWASGHRGLDLKGAGNKRTPIVLKGERRCRARRLIPTIPSERPIWLVDDAGLMLLSAPSKPEWLNANFDPREEDEQEQIEAGFL